MLRRAVTAALLLGGATMLTGGCEAVQRGSARATCAATAQTCLLLYSGGEVVKAIKDPEAQPIPGGGIVFQDATGSTYMWSGDFLLRNR